ncbi:MscL family protein [Mycobacteroides immunogenum]|uniref:MscL family protein n=1 Tax=Mycobacteroides immunogenum TaxID=83262 RepID=UPI000695ECAC|nr:MscL family protein [Mycobacteroides immunogenum]ANO04629.1 hypothetical protein BAB75_15770 [Mycobacteroides immunogenum]MCV7305433.1 MscL family protein [Mycobacteroides immunogenum]ORV78599.1 hypothetical protein AWC10_12615 [Mycobacteroides immunogenum]
MLKGARDSLLRGNVIDPAVSVVIGAGFAALMAKFSDSIIHMFINMVDTELNSDYPALSVGINGGQHLGLRRN